MENERERPCLPLGLTGSEKLDQENVSPPDQTQIISL